MALALDTIPAFLNHGFDAVIDVRSPAEFAEDHVPGAISLPVLSNEERARVGTIYKQDSPFAAKKVGAALVARNAAAHVEGPLAAMNGAWRPLVYCWRGGQRSGSFALILSQIGWRADTVAGGYQSWRRLVHAALYDGQLAHRLILLDGNTGTAKTDILQQVAAAGGQVLDLEGLARHRGSMLGGVAGGQPAQRGFESALAATLARLDPARPVLVEAESSRIGRITLPPALWAAMCAAPRIEVAAPVPARAAYLTRAYAEVIAAPERLAELLQPLRTYRGHATVDRWLALLRAGDHPALARALIEDHYDPAYARSRAAHQPVVLTRIELPGLSAADLAQAAGRVIGAGQLAA
jgi:tRNA 2-selenouridine synthase